MVATPCTQIGLSEGMVVRLRDPVGIVDGWRPTLQVAEMEPDTPLRLLKDDGTNTPVFRHEGNPEDTRGFPVHIGRIEGLDHTAEPCNVAPTPSRWAYFIVRDTVTTTGFVDGETRHEALTQAFAEEAEAYFDRYSEGEAVEAIQEPILSYGAWRDE